MKNKICRGYCGLTCVNGHCPNALDEMDRNSDSDEYACYHLEEKVKCKDCFYNYGCKDCFFSGTIFCVKTLDSIFCNEGVK